MEDVQNDGNIDAAGKYIATDAVDHSAPPGLPTDLEGAKLIFQMFRSAFPDQDAVVRDDLQGALVATRKSVTGTHQGPTGRPVTVDVIDFVRVRDGKIVEHWNIVDQLGLMRQLGVLP